MTVHDESWGGRQLTAEGEEDEEEGDDCNEEARDDSDRVELAQEAHLQHSTAAPHTGGGQCTQAAQ